MAATASAAPPLPRAVGRARAAEAAPLPPWDRGGPLAERLQPWLERRLRDAPRQLDTLQVELRDPMAPSPAECDALRQRLQRCGMAIYVTRPDPDRPADVALPLRIGAALGLRRLDGNWLADEEGVSHLQVRPGIAAGQDYIPYTCRALGWHTDGYYNPPERQIHAMLLHCVRPAAEGGVNRLLDHALATALLMQRDPALVQALFHPQALAIPARMEADGSQRPRQTGPVLRLGPGGALHMRYTARSVSIEWRDDALTRAAAQALRELLDDPATPVLRGRLEAGWGLVCANVLHDRSAFVDDPAAPRLLLRARYLDALDCRRTDSGAAAAAGLQRRDLESAPTWPITRT